ncbi:hypothetical protein SSX86_029683 [Deinandra increscens subsp. villosa]|uniref:Alkaline/neutral invertase n=1 Tax=Deinandra increscens subsp. villosa TaxID=3103831 RepID=A0AAP0GKB9_9ASTR
MVSSECSEQVPSSSSDELQFPMDDDQANNTGKSAAEKSVSSEAPAQLNDTTDEIWRTINNKRDCFPTNRDDYSVDGLERATALKCAIGDEEKAHDSSTQSQCATESLEGTDGGGHDGEKSGRGSVENKMILKPSPSVGTSLLHLIVPEASGAKLSNGSERGSSSMMDDAWSLLRKSYVHFQKVPVGTLAAVNASEDDLNYNQVFVRDFVPTALACLMKVPDPEPEIVKNFLLKTLHLQGWKKTIDSFTLGEGVMPASFKVMYDSFQGKDVLKADFGGSAIGRVAPVDSGFWWIILLRSYIKCTGDYTLSERPEVQKGMKLILDLCLSDGFDTFPTLLCADGCSMIDRRMGIYGYPIEIQALFFFALRCAQQMLKEDTDLNKLIERIERRITALSYHIRNYYWLDFTQLNNIYRYKTEEYSHTAVNKFNVNPESIPDWVFDFMPLRGGYFIGNVSPARMDFRWFLVGNCIAILSSLATEAQTTAIMDLVEERWEDLIGEMPLKIAYPALEGYEWNIVTGCDPKNTRWSYHNGGSWPVLLWLLTAACIKAGRPQIAKRAIELVEQRLSKDGWPEYYDGKKGRYVGKQARKNQTWSISGYLVAKLMIENPSNLAMISLEEDKKIAKPRLTRSASWPCSR